MSNLQDKSNDLVAAAKLLHNNGLYSAVAHSAYYCCVQLMRHIWLYSMQKTFDDLTNEVRIYNDNAKFSGGKGAGMHEFLIKKTSKYIRDSHKNALKDFRKFNANVWQLRDLRNDADYSDNAFCDTDSLNSLELSNIIINVLKKY